MESIFLVSLNDTIVLDVCAHIESNLFGGKEGNSGGGGGGGGGGGSQSPLLSICITP